MMKVIPLIILAICFIVFIRKPIRGVYALAACIAFWLEWKVGLRIGLIDVAVIGCSLGIMLHPEAKAAEKTPLKFLVVSLCLICIISSIWHPKMEMKDLFRRLLDIYKSIYVPLVFFVFYKLINTKQQLKNVIWLVIASSTATAIFGIIQAITQKPITLAVGTYGQAIRDGGYIEYAGILRAFGTLADANIYGGFLVFSTAITISVIILNNDIKYNKICWFAAGLQVLALLLSLSRGSLLGFVLSLVLVLLFTGLFKKIKTWAIIVLLMVVVVGGETAGLHIIPNRLKSRTISIEHGTKDDAMTPRYARWAYFYKRSLQRPLTGWGTVADPETNEYFEGIAVSPHNTYLFIAVKRGYIALAIVILIVILTVFSSFSNYRYINDPIIKGLNIGIMSSFIGLFSISAIFDPYLQENQVDIMFWLFVALAFKSKWIVWNEAVETESQEINA
jgi:O-antigen ligase